MKAAAFVIIIVAATVGFAQPSMTSQDQSVARELENIERQLAKAWLNGDRAFVERILADDWTVTDFAGQVLTRRQVVDEGFVSRDRRITAAKVEDLSVRVFGECAVVTGKSSMSGEYRGKAASVVARFTDVFVRGDKGWQVVASQATRLQ